MSAYNIPSQYLLPYASSTPSFLSLFLTLPLPPPNSFLHHCSTYFSVFFFYPAPPFSMLRQVLGKLKQSTTALPWGLTTKALLQRKLLRVFMIRDKNLRLFIGSRQGGRYFPDLPSLKFCIPVRLKTATYIVRAKNVFLHIFRLSLLDSPPPW